MKTACAQCPWRLANQCKKPDPLKFYTKSNLNRLWGLIRRGGNGQSCHLTDPSHPDHVKAGAPENATAQECPGSIIVVMREVERLADGATQIEPEHLDRYLADRKRHGLSKQGLAYWLVSRLQMGGTILGGPKLPFVDVKDAEVGLPEHLREG